ncbi:MAG: TonB-dependent receptor [Bacteroidota bacterium]
MKIFFTALLSVMSTLSLAQSSLEITVYDRVTDAPLSQYAITIENTSIGQVLTKNTDEQGKVKFQSLSTSGQYTIKTAETDGYYAFEKGGIAMKSNQLASITILLNARSVVNLDEVVISGSNFSQINTVNAEVSAELTAKEIETLPIEGRDVTRVLYRLPNVTQATGFYPEAPNVAINGANSLFTNYLIDGLDNNENFLGGLKFNIPVGFTQNITVLANNYSAEYGNTANGIFNFTTKSGSNDFSGEAYYILRPGTRELLGITFDASSPLAQRDLSGNQVRDGFQRHQFGFGFGGPIVKDKTFYFVNVEHTSDLKDNLLNSPELGVNETVEGNNNFTYLSAKIDHKWNSRWNSSLRVNSGIVNIERQGGGLEGGVSFPSTGNQQDRNSLLIANRNVFSNNNFFSETNLQFARFRWDYANPDNPASPNVTVLNPNDQTIAVLGHPGFIFNSLEETYQLQQKFVYFKHNHTLKAGFDVISSDHTLLGGGNPNGSYTVRLNQSQLDNLRAQKQAGLNSRP